MKRMILFLSMAMLSVVLVACGGNGDNQTSNTTNNNTTNETEQSTENNESTNNSQPTEEESTTTDADDMKTKMDELDYAEFELEVDYGENKEYEAEIEQDNNQVEAELEDDLNGEDLKSQEAFDKIYPLVEQLTIDQDTKKDDAIAEVLDVFELDDNYKSLELEITFQDGTEVEFEAEK